MTEQPVNYVRTYVEPLANRYIIRLDRELTDPSDFQEELTTLRVATENDLVHIIINSGGGRIDTMKAFLSSMAQFQGHCITEIEGSCCSAATMIFLAGDELRVSDDAEFMIHTQSFGYGGKENNVRQFVEFNASANERLMKKYYRHYLTEEEINEVIDGKDVWHNTDDIMERLEFRARKLEEEEAEAQQEAIKQQELELFGEPLPREQVEKLDKETLVKLICQELSEEEEEKLLEDILSESDKTPETISVLEEMNLEALKLIAEENNISYQHNIGLETLRKKVIEKLDNK